MITSMTDAGRRSRPTRCSATSHPTARPSPVTPWGPSPPWPPSTTRAASSPGPAPPSPCPGGRCPSTAATSPNAPPVPLLLLHGDQDTTVPIAASQQAFAELHGFRWFVTIHGAGHVSIFFPRGAGPAGRGDLVPELPPQGRPPPRDGLPPAGEAPRGWPASSAPADRARARPVSGGRTGTSRPGSPLRRPPGPT